MLITSTVMQMTNIILCLNEYWSVSSQNVFKIKPSVMVGTKCVSIIMYLWKTLFCLYMHTHSSQKTNYLFWN